MEVVNVDNAGDIKYLTIKVVNKLINVDKIIELIENVEDYIGQNGEFDKDSFKEDVLNPREYLVTIDGTHTACTCKAQVFKKTICRHIRYCKNYLLTKENEN